MSIWSILNFIILMVGLGYAVRKMVAPGLSEKHEATKKEISDAEELRLHVEKMVLDYKDKLAKLDTEVENIIKEAREEGERTKKEILARAEKLAQKIKEDAQFHVEREKERLKKELERETLAQAIEKAREFLRTSVSERDHTLFTQELISKLESSHGA